MPDMLYGCLSDLLGLFDTEAYQLRNSLVNILGNFVMLKLGKVEEVEEEEKRIQMR